MLISSKANKDIVNWFLKLMGIDQFNTDCRWCHHEFLQRCWVDHQRVVQQYVEVKEGELMEGNHGRDAAKCYFEQGKCDVKEGYRTYGGQPRGRATSGRGWWCMQRWQHTPSRQGPGGEKVLWEGRNWCGQRLHLALHRRNADNSTSLDPMRMMRIHGVWWLFRKVLPLFGCVWGGVEGRERWKLPQPYLLISECQTI